ncbi:MAG: DUF1800 family protein [Alteromonadaceae bacterium]|nr:DUF1800 family protein [Alteromonadaceae bacterium]
MKFTQRTTHRPRFAWHAMLLATIYTCLMFTSFDIYAKDSSVKPTLAQKFSINASKTISRRLSGLERDCDGDEICERIIELCEDRAFCLELLRICLDDPELCEEILEEDECEVEGDGEECDEMRECDDDEEDCDDMRECDDDDEECDDMRECEEDEEDCDDIRECDEDDEDCDDMRECDEDDEDCDDMRECDEDEEDCDDIRECEEDQEDCEDMRECDEDEEDCEDIPECDENSEECEDIPECDENSEECEDIPECDENSEECEEAPECDESSEECEDAPECDESSEECEEAPECDESSEECEEAPECDESSEECEEAPECDENNEDCSDTPECNEEDEDCTETPDCDEENEEECEASVTEQPSGYVNPNPAADRTIMTVSTEAANDASRFLTHATFGGSYATISQVASIGPDMWLEQQFEQPVGYTMPFTQYLVNRVIRYEEENEDLNDEQLEAIYELIGDPERYWVDGWWTQVMTSPDMVRQRVAMALSEIFVVSANVEEIGANNYAMATYYDVLLENSFGNFRDLLKAVTLSPTMGFYLSHIHNAKADPTKGTFPDENYAREVMQLFSIGLYELNTDGTRKVDGSGNFIPTYGQEDIREFAKIFTGLSWDSCDPNAFGKMDIFELECEDDADTFTRQMKMYEEHHEPGVKSLLNGQVVPAGQSGMQDIDAAIDNLFNHPNVGPFIGKQLIQRLVKSNPSPDYISRVSAAFNGETGSARGDMKAVLRAILLDPEARRSPSEAATSDGRLREPFLRVVHLMRAFNATSSDNTFSDDGYEMAATLRQYVLSAPSVFNFYLPNYAPNGEIKDAGLVAPEFQITNASTIIDIKNVIYYSLETGQVLANSGALPAEKLDFTEELAIASDVDALLDRLDTVMTYGSMTSETKAIIKDTLESINDNETRVATAVYLIAISPDYAVAI